VKAYSAASAESPLAPTTIPRRDPGERDVQIGSSFVASVTHLHQIRNEWSGMPTVYPCVPGHEIVGRVTKVGSAVTKFNSKSAESSQLILAKFRITVLYDPGLGMFVNILMNLQVRLVWQLHTAFLTTIYFHIDFFFETACKSTELRTIF
jgi:hypothetical protein